MTSSAWLLSAAVPGRLARLGSFPFGDLEGCGRLSMSGVGTGFFLIILEDSSLVPS